MPKETGLELSEAILNSYTGKFVAPGDPKRPLIISKDGNHLFAGISGEWKAELTAFSETKFNIKNISPAGTIVFVKDADGKISKIVVAQSGKDFEALRADP